MYITQLVNQGIDLYKQFIQTLDYYSDSFSNLFLRFVLAWEFGEAGFEKLSGSNWFTELSFPFPLNILPADVSWAMATYFEIFGAAALLLGVATRFFSFSLLILTVVAIYTVHWPEQWHTLSELFTGYRIIDEAGDGFGNYKLPLIFIVMLLPLILGGAGKLSVDYLIRKRWLNQRTFNLT